jgi:alpha,alpha-trehalase
LGALESFSVACNATGRRAVLALSFTLLSACAPPSAAIARPAPSATGSIAASDTRPRALATPQELEGIFEYVKHGWAALERSNKSLLQIARDAKFPTKTGKWPIYISEDEDQKRIEDDLKREMAAADFAQVELRSLPSAKKLPIPAPAEPGVLYLPKPYVVPGGRFNEMYGWDSYFILLGLVRDGEVERARGMVDNFVYEIAHYGMILNANRSYYLTRSQPPFFTEMILAVYAKTGDKAWLQSTRAAIDRYYALWSKEPHLTPATGLSRYHDLGRGPAAEVLSAERDSQGRSHYDRVRDWFRNEPVAELDSSRFYDRTKDALTDLFYVADRSMRESGYDPSGRFGPFNVGVLDYDPVCLNSLLYRMENEAGEILRILGDGGAAARWDERAAARAAAINRYLWDPAASLYLDYDFEKHARRNYPFGTTFFPLWAKIASQEQAIQLVRRALPLLEAPGGLKTSANESGNQWDAPFGWAPLEIVAAEGLRRYGFAAEADRISVNFLSLVLKEFLGHHAIFEKYDVEHRSSDVKDEIRFGYSSNEIGFGWTNAAFVTMFDALPVGTRADVRRLAGVGLPAR